MRILHINRFLNAGGAARAAFRLHEALRNSNIDSVFLTPDSITTEYTVRRQQHSSIALKVYRKIWQKYHQRRIDKLCEKESGFYSLGATSANILPEIRNLNSDIVNLHWTSDVLSIPDVRNITKPIVWTFHDMWPMCGAEHYTSDKPTANFRIGYSTRRNFLGENSDSINSLIWRRKRKNWAELKFTVVSPSKWLATCAAESILFKNADIHTVPNPIDAEGFWSPLEKKAARHFLNLPKSKNLILMGAAGGVEDPRKGGDLLRRAMHDLHKDDSLEAEILIFGQEQPTSSAQDWPYKVHWLGQVQDDRLLKLIYSAADIMIVPSRQDNLPNTAVEAQACGLPVVAFKTGGLPDIIAHKKTGWLANPFAADDLAAGIAFIIRDRARRMKMSAAARQHCLSNYSYSRIANRYREIYSTILRKGR